MTRERTDYDERFEMLYSSIIIQNSSWSEAAMSFTRSVHRWENGAGLSSSGVFQGPVSETSRGQCSLSQEAWYGHNQSASVQKRTSGRCHWPERDPSKYARERRGLGAQQWRESGLWKTQVTGGSENSIVISDEGTDCEMLAEGDSSRMTSSPIKDGNTNVDALWILEDDDGFQDREHEALGQDYAISLPNVEQDVLKFGGVIGDPDCSDSLSTESGPTLSADFTLQSPCPACAKLFRKMRKVKHWKKRIEYDPASLSCDQWVLKKFWRPRPIPNRKGKLWQNISRIRKRALSDLGAGEIRNPKASCSRPHVFLHRNLLSCKKKEALDRRKPRHVRVAVDSCRSDVPVGARERRRRKRKLFEMEPPEEGPLHAHSSGCRGEGAALSIGEDSGEKNNARRKLQFNGVSLTPDPKRQYDEPQSQKTTQRDIKRDSHCTSASKRRSETSKPLSFRSMLAELEGKRSMVV